jgi:hypothetical protein
MTSRIRRAVGLTAALAAVTAGSLTVAAPASEAATVACSALTTPVYKSVNPSMGDQWLTVSQADYKASTSSRGFTAGHGVLGLASKVPAAGLVAVTRLYNPKTVDYLWVAGAKEVAAAKLYGYRTQAVAFYASRAASSCTVGVHKFIKGTHRRNAITTTDRKALLAQGWKDAGAAFYVSPPAGSKPAPVVTPKPSPAPAPAPAPTPAPTSGYGVPANTALRVVNGDLTITEPGTVLSNVDLNGYLTVRADNVTIKNSILRGGAAATTGRALVMSWSGAKNLVVQDSTLVPRYPSAYVDGISGKDFTAERVNISGTVDAVKVTGSNVIVRNSWLHDAYYRSSGVKYQADGSTHNDGVQIEGGGNITISGTKISGFHNSAIMVTQNVARITGLNIQGNTLSGGGCTVNMAEKGKGGMGGVRVVSNRFGRNNTGSYACPMLIHTITKAVISGNTWLDKLTAALPYRG